MAFFLLGFSTDFLVCTKIPKCISIISHERPLTLEMTL
jgi:hypothetical protein